MAWANKWLALAVLGAALVACAAETADDFDAALLERMARLEQELSGIKAAKKVVQERRAAAAADPWAGAPSATDSIWLLLCGSLVMFMQCGFAMLECGCCRAKNAQNILMKNLADVCGGTLGWFVCGWAFAYGGPYKDGYTQGGLMGSEQYFGAGFLTTDEQGNQLPDPNGGALMLSWFFQWAFCGAAATIVSGGVAERVVFPGYFLYSLVMTSFIYPLIVCWTWGFGWLAGGEGAYINEVGFMDFAGSGIVHMTGGMGALVGAWASGPRNGRFLADGAPDDSGEFDAHNIPMAVLGTMILWFGWYGFNCGSTLGLSDAKTGALAAQVAMNTTIAAAAGGITVFTVKFVVLKKYDVLGFCNGILAGLVSVTAGCGNIECGSAFVIGVTGGFVYFGAAKMLKKLQIDDPLDAFPIHGCCGAWGTLAAALFDWGGPQSGFNHANGWNGFDCYQDGNGNCKQGAWSAQLAANVVQIISIAVWVGGMSAIVFIPMRHFGLLRADDDLQMKGMDPVKHSPMRGYALSIPTSSDASLKVNVETPPAVESRSNSLEPTDTMSPTLESESLDENMAEDI
jgi:Amt family ammonium transporter